MKRGFLHIFITGLLTLVFLNPAQNTAHAKFEWQISKSRFSKTTAGYLYPSSITPGQKVTLFITCPSGTYSLQILRMGYYAGDGAELISEEEPRSCIQQPEAEIDPLTNMRSNHWQESGELNTALLRPGLYLIKIISSAGGESFMNLVVKDHTLAGRLVIVIPTLTDAAYNKFNKVSSYGNPHDIRKRARVVSLDQPNSESFGTGKYLLNIHPLLVIADQLHLTPAFITDVDIATIPNLLHGAKVIISGGHDEYWTVQERNAYIKARSEKTNIVFFGANVEYWRVRLSSSQLGPNRQMEIYKSATEDPNKLEPTVRFRDLTLPESVLTGQQYQCFPARGEFTVTRADLFIFEGTQVKNGEMFSGIIGPEVDRVPEINHFEGRFAVAAHSAVKCWRKTVPSDAFSDFFYGVSPSGAGTISVGTMNWVTRGLTKEVPPASFSLVEKVTKNILIESAKGPLGEIHPLNRTFTPQTGL
jgi:hypothetical protein